MTTRPTLPPRLLRRIAQRLLDHANKRDPHTVVTMFVDRTHQAKVDQARELSIIQAEERRTEMMRHPASQGAPLTEREFAEFEDIRRRAFGETS